MKRNFLLMLLLTLLPMTIWAATDLSKAKLSVRNVPYGTAGLVAGNAVEIVEPGDDEDEPAGPESDFRTSWDRDLVLGTDFTWNGKIYSDQACTTEVTNLATAPVGYYYVKFVGIGFFEGEVVCPFQILKKKLYVSVKGDIIEEEVSEQVVGFTGEWISTTYGEPFDLDDIEGIVDYEGLVNDEDFEDVVKGEITAVTTEETNANASPANVDRGFIPFDANNGDPDDPQVGGYVDGYVATLVGLTSDNYEIVCVNPLYIVQKDISDGEGLTFLLDPKFATYNSKVQEPAYKITYGNAVLKQGGEDGDFTVSYPDYVEDDDFEGPVAVGEYETAIVGQGNYCGTYPAEDAELSEEEAANFVWEIKPVGLTIITHPQTKVYDGNKSLVYTEEGELDGTDDEKQAYAVLYPYGVEEPIGTITVAPKDCNGNVGTYDIKVTVTGKNENYDYNIQEAGKFTIVKRGLTIIVPDERKKVTYTDPNFALLHSSIEFEPTLVEDEDGNEIEWEVPNNDKTNFFKSVRDGGANLHIVRTNSDVNEVGVYKEVLNADFTNNGQIKNYDVIVKKGTFTITGGKIYITALNQSKNYGDDDPVLTYRIDIENQAGKTVQLVTEPTLTRTEGEAVGDYTITASGAVAPAEYDDIVYANGKFTIKPRPITITLANQTMKDGDKVSTLDQNAYTLEGTFAPGDEASDLFKLKLVPFERAAEGSPYVPGVPAVEPQDAVWSFASYSSDGTDPGDWNYGVGEVEVGETEEYDDEDYTEVTVTKNEPRGETTWRQAQEFVDNIYFVKVNPDDVELEEGASLPGRYQLYTKEEVIGRTPNPAYDAEAAAAAAEAGEEYNVPEYLIEPTGDYVMNGTGIWVVITLAKAAVEGQPAIPEQPEVEPGEESGVYVEGTGKKTAVVLRAEDGNLATYTPGIYLEVLNAEKWANYDVTNGGDIDYVYGEEEAQVTVPAATLYVITKDALVLDTRDTELAQKIEEADGDDKFIAFANRTLKAGQWNVLVLPFETSVAELSETFGYAVVDMLDETNATTSTVKLSLAFGEIPANTPFLVHPAEDVVLSDGIFFEKEVVYSENPEVEDMAGHHFKGTYTIHYVTSEDKSEYYLQNPTAEGKQAFVNSTSRTRIGSTGAYIKDGNSGTPNEVRYISIQDPDGEENVTAIGEIAADAASKADANADGWYNVQGMKLNAAPTQRGIYIKDGKKVLVK